MKYILNADEFTEIEETSGTLVNIADVPVEVSIEPTHNTGIILFPKQHFPFKEDAFALCCKKRWRDWNSGSCGDCGRIYL